MKIISYIILNPHNIGIPILESHLFQIFAAIACYQIWFTRNKAHHENLVPHALVIPVTINRYTTLLGLSSWLNLLLFGRILLPLISRSTMT
jgi:hypothetical protein